MVGMWSLHFVHMWTQAGAWRQHSNSSGGISPEILKNYSVGESSAGSPGRASQMLKGLTHVGTSRTGVCRD